MASRFGALISFARNNRVQFQKGYGNSRSFIHGGVKTTKHFPGLFGANDVKCQAVIENPQRRYFSAESNTNKGIQNEKHIRMLEFVKSICPKEILNKAERSWTNNSERTGLIAIKRGMVSYWDSWGIMKVATVLEVVDCMVMGTEMRDGQLIMEVGSNIIENGTGSKKSHSKKYYYKKSTPPVRYKTFFPVTYGAWVPEGTPLKVAHFIPGQYVSCTARSNSKGFQGGMKRWGFKGQCASHGVTKAHRKIGSVGTSTTPGKVIKGKKMPGNMGADRITIKLAQVIKIDTGSNLMFVNGSIPGPIDRPVIVKDSAFQKNRGFLFPSNTYVPFPTYLGDLKDLDSEIWLPEPDENAADPNSVA